MVELLHSPCVFKGPPKEATPSEVAISRLPSRGPESGRKGYVTPAFSGVRHKKDKIRIGYPIPVFLGARKWWDWYIAPVFSRGRQKRRQYQKQLSQPSLLEGPKVGGMAM